MYRCLKRDIGMVFVCVISFVSLINTYNVYSQENSEEATVVSETTVSGSSEIDTSINEQNSKNQETDTQAGAVNEEDLLFLEAPESSDVEVQNVGAGDVIRIFLVLFFILGIGIGFVWILKKIQSGQQNSNEEIIDIISSKALNQSSSLHVIKLARGYLLVSNSGQNINLIKEYTEKEDVDEIELKISKAVSEQDGEEGGFLSKLQARFSISTTKNHNNNTSKKENNFFSSFIDVNSILRKGNR